MGQSSPRTGLAEGADVRRVAYCFDLTNGRGPHVVEQQAYYQLRDGRISYLRVMCSGFRPVPGRDEGARE